MPLGRRANGHMRRLHQTLAEMGAQLYRPRFLGHLIEPYAALATG
jgi:hypothetical protein